MPRLQLREPGELRARIAEAVDRLAACSLCPRACGVNRLQGEVGFCGAGRLASVASFTLHFGEEAPLVGPGRGGRGGSGTIFFAGCNLGCCFCQNADISMDVSSGTPVRPAQLAEIMLSLQHQGAENINLVTPSHVAPQILEALALAQAQGLRLPIVYNSSAYDNPETLQLFDGVVDIYLPDAKFWDNACSNLYCRTERYPAVAREAIREMHRQVGDLVLDGRGVAVSGLLVRHLVLPGGLAGTRQWMEFLAREISPNTYVNLMDQYRPCHDAPLHAAIARSITMDEYQEAKTLARQAGITRLDDAERVFTLNRLLSLLAAENDP